MTKIHLWLGLMLMIAAPLHAQNVCHLPPEVGYLPGELLQRPIAIRGGIGVVQEKVTTTSPQAQAFYDQGLALLHSYSWIDAARSFYQALRHDQKLAMAYVGLSRAYSGLVQVEQSERTAIRAQELVEGVTPRERTRIELLQVHVAAIVDYKSDEKLTRYRRAIDEALALHFDDVELWLIRGNIEDRFGARGIGQFGNLSSIPFYEHALSLNRDHFGAHHYLVHSYESISRIDDALREGAIYAASAPEIPHAHHMWAHDLRRVGRTREAIEQFEIADRLERAWFEREKANPRVDWHHPHNLDLLATTYQHEGQMKRAEELMKRSQALEPVTEFQAMNKKEWPAYLLLRGRVDEARRAAERMTESKFAPGRAAGHLFVAQAMLASGDVDGARKRLTAAEAEVVKFDGPRADHARGYAAPYIDKVRGAILMRTNQNKEGRELLKRVAKSLRALPGPDSWSQALFELESIARMARDAGDWDLAEFIAEQMLEHDIAYAGSHYAMALVAERSGRTEDAKRHLADVRRLWRGADRDLTELRQ